MGGTDNNSKQEDAKLSKQCTWGSTVQHAHAHAHAPRTTGQPLMSDWEIYIYTIWVEISGIQDLKKGKDEINTI